MSDQNRWNRRQVLQAAGYALSLPLLESLVPEQVWAASQQQKRFIGAYFPNGAYMPTQPEGWAANGNWKWEGALSPLVQAGLKENTIIMRGLKSQLPGDHHWNNTAGFLSCKGADVRTPGTTICGKSLDQYVAEQTAMPIPSLAVGWQDRTFNEHDGIMSVKYLNTISWRQDNQPISKINDPQELFNRLFGITGSGAGAAAVVRHLQGRRKSVLDQVVSQISRAKRRVASADGQRLDAYFQTIREAEADLSKAPNTCEADKGLVAGNSYIEHFQSLHKMIVRAFECQLTAAVTIMYDDGVGNLIPHLEMGVSELHHSCAHHGNRADMIENLKKINLGQVGLLADLVKRLKTSGQLDNTLVVYGSDMADGNLHTVKNLPIVVCGRGSDLRYGQEIGTSSDERNLSDLYVELAPVLGVTNLKSMGVGDNLSTGKSVGILRA